MADVDQEGARSKSGSLAMLAAMRRASSPVTTAGRDPRNPR
jgi:hypothetical protein